MAKTLNQRYRDKTKVRVGGRGQALKGFSPKDVANLQKSADEKKGAQKSASKSSRHK